MSGDPFLARVMTIFIKKKTFGLNSHFWKRSGAQDMTILPDLLVVGFQISEIISKIIHLEVQIQNF